MTLRNFLCIILVLHKYKCAPRKNKNYFQGRYYYEKSNFRCIGVRATCRLDCLYSKGGQMENISQRIWAVVGWKRFATLRRARYLGITANQKGDVIICITSPFYLSLFYTQYSQKLRVIYLYFLVCFFRLQPLDVWKYISRKRAEHTRF